MPPEFICTRQCSFAVFMSRAFGRPVRYAKRRVEPFFRDLSRSIGQVRRDLYSLFEVRRGFPLGRAVKRGLSGLVPVRCAILQQPGLGEMVRQCLRCQLNPIREMAL